LSRRLVLSSLMLDLLSFAETNTNQMYNDNCMKFSAFFACSFLFGFNVFAQQLIINELSQGPSGSKEYVEFVVAGTPSCTQSCLDMRGIVIDDNNGYFRSGSGQGIAQGSMRFANTSFWQCIPIGTIIVIYNEGDQNASMPADDISMSDGNNLLIFPASSTLLESHATIPSTSTNNYSTTGWVTGGFWNSVGMANGDDSFQIRQNVSSTTPSHAVSWGTNNQNTIIYFAGAAGGLVYNFKNTVDNNPASQANWTSDAATSGQTPGAPNSTQNAAWINAMLSNTGALDLTMSSTNTGCGTNCTGTASVAVSGGTGPYTYSWSNGGNTAAISNLCANTYTVEVTDVNGCESTEQVIISNTASTLDATVSTTSETCIGACNGTAGVVATGGTSPYTYSWTNSSAASSINNLCANTYSVTVTDALGCVVTESGTVSSGTSSLAVAVSSTNESCLNACNGTISAVPTGGSSPYTYAWSNGTITATDADLCAGAYSLVVTDAIGCTVNGSTTVATNPNPLVLTTNDTDETCDNTCDGSVSVTVTGGTTPYSYSWNNGANANSVPNLCDGNYSVTVTDQNGCQSSATATVAAGPVIQMPVLTPIGPLTTSDAPVQIVSTIPGLTWGGNCVNCIDGNGIFNPANSGPGTFQICQQNGAGACAQTACITVIVTEGCQTQNTSSSLSACPGETITFDGQLIAAEGNYTFTYQGVDGCDSIHTLQFSYFTTSPVHDIATICMGDSVEVHGTWYSNQTVANYETTDINGCILQNTTTIMVNDCYVEPYDVFIPNTFTPNGDLTNDFFPIVISGGELQRGYIFNRWGQVVKEFSATDLQWDGRTQSGANAPDGVYTYMVVIQKNAGIAQEFHGFVTLVR
jgi:gliding motility-associated-like protein